MCAACKHSDSTKSRAASYEAIALELYDGPVEYFENATGEFILCMHDPQPTAAGPSGRVAFFAYDVGQERVVYDSRAIMGTVMWYDAYRLVLDYTPGIVLEDGPSYSAFLIDVRTGEKTSYRPENERK